ncbi:MAG TPA: alpha/beta hydrolase [Stellaceae bacterium]|nr:alpha/beta hydrolase [Stellaceae bacterium]
MALYRDYDKAGLDAQYNIRARVTDHEAWSARWAAAAEAVLKTRPSRLNIAYDREKLDVFPAARTPAPALIFIHGGYWQSRSKEDFCFIVPAFQDAGVAVVMVEYTLAPKATMDEIVRQNRAAVAFVHKHARDFGIDPARIHVAGHSAGGHLAAMMMVTDWTMHGLDRHPLAGGCAISGLYDLEPIRLCYLNEVLGMDAAAAARNSPIHLVPRAAPPLILALGTAESEEFHRQQEVLAGLWRRHGLRLETADQPGDHHFSVIQRLGEPDSLLHRSVMRQIAA